MMITQFVCIGLVCATLLTIHCVLPAKVNAEEGANPVARLETTKGTIDIELYPDKAPDTVNNFITYVKDGFYDGTIFHRVINGFMIQGGGMDKDMNEKTTREPIKNEADNGLKNETYTIAMARTMDPHSASSQFFINVNDNYALDFTAPTPRGWGYAVFGKVIAGQDVVDAIKAVATGTRGFHENVPTEPIIITKAEMIK